MKPEMERHIGLIVAETMKVVFFTMSQHISPYIFLYVEHTSAFWGDRGYAL